MIKKLKKNEPTSNRSRLQSLLEKIRVLSFGGDLNKLGQFYGTDKIGSHFYTPHYMTHLRRFRYKRINLLEIGVGGYDNPRLGGNSLRMWKKYFPFGRIYSLDIHDKSALQEKRIKIFKGSQVDKNFLDKVVEEIGQVDIIIDDGSHINEHVIETFNFLFPKLKDGGIYVIEDTQTSYWEDFGGNSIDLNNSKTLMNYFKSLTDALNNQEFINPNYKQNYFDKKIVSMHFYHNLIFIYKGNNDEKSNVVVNNQRLIWNPQSVIDEIKDLVPTDEVFILVDQEILTSSGALAPNKVFPFTEKDGVFNGLPADDASAIEEIERQRKNGATSIIFSRPAFWCLDYYSGMHNYLKSNYNCIINNERLIGFDLQSNKLD